MLQRRPCSDVHCAVRLQGACARFLFQPEGMQDLHGCQLGGSGLFFGVCSVNGQLLSSGVAAGCWAVGKMVVSVPQLFC
jgi:hypothetical protein